MLCPIRVEQFAGEEVDLKLGVSLDFQVLTPDLSEVRQMMESINVLPGQTPSHNKKNDVTASSHVNYY